MGKSRLARKKSILKKVRAIHVAVSATLFITYVLMSISYSPEFFFHDLKGKFSALADGVVTVTAKVLAPPVKPVVTLSGACAMGVYTINLSWPSDENSTSYDISRNGFPLVTGTTFQTYVDSNTAPDTTYSYVVTAHGPMGAGFADSDPAVAVSPTVCGSNSEPPTITLNPLNPGDPFYTIVDTTRPRFSGTTNIPYGIIDLEIHSQQILSGQTIANVNGYWSWDPPLDLANGLHTLFASVQDPLDPSRTVSAQLYFIVNVTVPPSSNSSASNNSSGNGNQHQKQSAASAPVSPAPAKPAAPSVANPGEQFVAVPLDFSSTLVQDTISQGNPLESIVTLGNMDPSYAGKQAELDYQVYDQKGTLVTAQKNTVTLAPQKKFPAAIALPSYLAPDKYTLKTILHLDPFVIEHENTFSITRAPFLYLGAGTFITYQQLLSDMGTTSLILLLLLLVWLFLFSREYWLSIHALRQITEKSFSKMGFVPMKKRKGVTK